METDWPTSTTPDVFQIISPSDCWHILATSNLPGFVIQRSEPVLSVDVIVPCGVGMIGDVHVELSHHLQQFLGIISSTSMIMSYLHMAAMTVRMLCSPPFSVPRTSTESLP